MAITARHPVIELDFSRYRRSDVIPARLFPEERAGLTVGAVVLIGGDSIDPEPFEVIAISHDRRVFTFRRLV